MPGYSDGYGGRLHCSRFPAPGQWRVFPASSEHIRTQSSAVKNLCDGRWIDPAGEATPRVVEEVFVRFGAVWRLGVGGRDVFTTPEHPFFEAAKGWVPCQELAAGDRLLCRDGSWVAVGAVEDTGRWETVYNFRIAEDHTYFVGCPEWGFGVWAHNIYDAKVEADLKRRIRGLDRQVQEEILRVGNQGHLGLDASTPWADRWKGSPLAALKRLSISDQLAEIRRVAQQDRLIPPDATGTEAVATSPHFSNATIPFEASLQEIALATRPELLEFMYFMDPSSLPDSVFHPGEISHADASRILAAKMQVEALFRGEPGAIDIPDEWLPQVMRRASLHNHPPKDNTFPSFSPTDLAGAIARREQALMMVEGGPRWSRLSIFVPKSFDSATSRGTALEAVATQYDKIISGKGGAKYARIDNLETLHEMAILEIASQYGHMHEIHLTSHGLYSSFQDSR